MHGVAIRNRIREVHPDTCNIRRIGGDEKIERCFEALKKVVRGSSVQQNTARARTPVFGIGGDEKTERCFEALKKQHYRT